NVHLFRVNRQLHNECAELVYGGSNTFLLFLTYEGIKWRYRWLLPSGQAPMRNYPFLELFPPRYLRLVNRVVVHVDLVDAYTGMIKFNVSGKGLVHGLRRQVQRLVNALKPVEGEEEEERYLTRLAVRVANSAVSEAVVPRRQSGKGGEVTTANADVETVLTPLRQLYGVRDVSISGAVSPEFARELRAGWEAVAANAKEVQKGAEVMVRAYGGSTGGSGSKSRRNSTSSSSSSRPYTGRSRSQSTSSRDKSSSHSSKTRTKPASTHSKTRGQRQIEAAPQPAPAQHAPQAQYPQAQYPPAQYPQAQYPQAQAQGYQGQPAGQGYAERIPTQRQGGQMQPPGRGATQYMNDPAAGDRRMA
ncbi:hypothetical protein LTR48_006022, partial [Friedmanniomyces endolithicus]